MDAANWTLSAASSWCYLTDAIEGMFRSYTDHQIAAILGCYYDIPGVFFDGKCWVAGDPPPGYRPADSVSITPEIIRRASVAVNQ